MLSHFYYSKVFLLYAVNHKYLYKSIAVSIYYVCIKLNEKKKLKKLTD